MNIVFTGGFTYPEGMAATKRVQHLIDYFVAQKIIPKVLVYHYNRNSGKEVIPHDIICKKILFFRLFYVFMILNKWKHNSRRNFIYIYDGINIENISIVLIARILSYKVVTDIVEDYNLHNENASTIQQFRIKTIFLFEKIINSLVDGIVVISKYLNNKYLGITNKPIILIPGSANLPKIEWKQNENKEYLTLAYVGSFGQKDGLNYLFEAFNIISKKNPNIKLKLTGKGNSIQEVLHSNSNDNIEYLGYLDEKKFMNFLNEADIFLMTRVNSVYANAGFPYKLPEYLSTGKPVIASNVSSIDEYLENYKDAILIQPESVPEIINAIEFLVQNPEIRKEIGLNGFKKYEKYFNYLINGRKLHEFLLQLC